MKNFEEEKCKLESKLKEELETQKSLKIQVEELTVKVAENAEMMAHHEMMKKHRDDLEKRVVENRWGDPGLPVSAGRGGQQR